MPTSKTARSRGDDVVHVEPPFTEWTQLAEDNRRTASGWDFQVGGLDAAVLRQMARAEMLETAAEYTPKLGIPVRGSGSAEALIAATGHQPEIYHPGIWVKDFLLQRFVAESGCTGVDFVVDSDTFSSLSIAVPCMGPSPAKCEQVLVPAERESCYGFARVPSEKAIRRFIDETAEALSTLPEPAPGECFEGFAVALLSAAAEASNLGELLTIARRRYERPTGNDYLEASVLRMCRREAFLRFVAHIAADARRYAGAFNDALREYRAQAGVRSSAQPFPDLRVEGSAIELPFWLVSGEGREAVWAVERESGTELVSEGRTILLIPAGAGAAAASLASAGIAVAPKASALTAFVRLFCSDIFIHGLGGGRYDRVTDGTIQRYFGIRPPHFVVASMTLYPPLSVESAHDADVALVKSRLNRLAHNPDEFLRENAHEGAKYLDGASALVREKASLVELIAKDGADRKALGARIRFVNAELAELLQPVRTRLEGELRELERKREDAKVFRERTYPYCLWDPCEIAAKVK